MSYTSIPFEGVPARMTHVPQEADRTLEELLRGRVGREHTKKWPAVGLFIVTTVYGPKLIDVETITKVRSGWLGKSGTFRGQISSALSGGWTWTDVKGEYDTLSKKGSVSFPADVTIL